MIRRLDIQTTLMTITIAACWFVIGFGIAETKYRRLHLEMLEKNMDRIEANGELMKQMIAERRRGL